MATISSAGIGSGLDVESIVTKLMAIEKQPVTQLQTQASTIQTKISAFGSLQSAVASFRDASLALTKSDSWGATTATSSDSASVAATSGSGAVAGTYSVSVQSLAVPQSLASQPYESSATTVGEGSLTINAGSWDVGEPGFVARATINAMNIPISSTDTLADVRDKINAAGGPVRASIISDASGARLVLTSTTAGVNNGFSVSGSGGGAAFSYEATDGSAPMARTQVAANGAATINGVAISTESNTLTDVMQGVTLNLSKVTTSDVQVTVTQDNTAIKKSIQDFVTSYNGLANSLKSQTKYDDATKTAGTLQGDSTAVSLQRQLRNLLSESTGASSVFSSLSQIGLEMQSDGQLKVNDSKLTSALGKLTEVKKLFANSSLTDSSQDGVAQRLRSFGDQVLGADGLLTTRAAGLNSSLTRNQNSQDALNTRLANTEKRIRAQYTALDTQVANLTALNTYITQQITNWNKTKA